MNNLCDFCNAVSAFCKVCDDLSYSYEIVKSDVSFDSSEFMLRVFSQENIISCSLFRVIPSSLSYYVFLNKDNRLCLIVR